MSLLEVILAIAVAGFVLAAAVSMLVSISSIWSERSERHFFVDHVDGVTEFLNATFANAGVEIAIDDDSETNANSGGGNPPEVQPPIIKAPKTSKKDDQKSTSGGLIRAADEPVEWARPPGYSESKDRKSVV